MIEIQLNGASHRIKTVFTVADLVASLGLEPTKLAVECNFEIVPKSLYTTTHLNAGDKIEIVTFVGGG